MNLFTRAIAGMFERRMSVSALDTLMDNALSGIPTWSGNRVSEQTALSNAAVWACVRVISESLASMPCHVYKRLPGGGKEMARNHYLYSLLHDQPNPEITAFDYRALLFAHLQTWGNHYSYIEWDNGGRVKALWPLVPGKVKVERKGDFDPLAYSFLRLDGTWMPIPNEDMFHIRGLGYDGVRGYSVIAMHRNTIGAADAVTEFGARFFANGVRHSGFLKVPQTLSEPGRKNLVESFGGAYAGLKNAHKVILLEGGVEFVPNSVPPEDAQFLETLKHGRSVIAGLFRVPPHMIGDLERATFSNIEQQSLEFVTFTLIPWMCRFEGDCERVLLTPAGRAQYFVEMDANGLMRGDSVSRAKYYQLATSAGWMSLAEPRMKENLNAAEACNVFVRPLNTAYVDQFGTPVCVTPPGETPPIKDDPEEGQLNAKAA